MSEADTIREGDMQLVRRAIFRGDLAIDGPAEMAWARVQAHLTALERRAEQAELSAKGWEETAAIYAQNDAHQRARAEQAEAERDAARSSDDAASKAASDNAQRANVAEAALREWVSPAPVGMDPNSLYERTLAILAATTPGEPHDPEICNHSATPGESS